MTSRPVPQCALCVHLRMDPERTCAAFPDGISDDIWWNRADHRRPRKGDRGIRWEALDGASFPEIAVKSFKHLPGQHNQRDHAGISSINAIAGIDVMDADRYADSYGELWDDAGVELGLDGDERGLTARFFERGDLHVVLDLEDGKRQVLEDVDPEGMRQLAYDLEEVLAVDETEFVGGDPYDIVADRDSEKHGFYVAKDGVGDIRIVPPGAEGGDYLELSQEQALEFSEKLLDVADSYEEHLDDFVDGEDVKARVKHPGHPDQSVHGRRRKPPKPASTRRRNDAPRDSLASARNVEEVAATAKAEVKRITGRDTEFDFTGSNVGIAREHAEGVLRGFERYPTARLTAVRVEKLRDGVFAKVEDRKNGTVMLFSLQESADPKRYRDFARMEKKYKVKVYGSPMGTAIHEFGHVVANQHHANGAVRSEASRLSLSTGYSGSSSMIRDRMSSYASENEYELSAEAFADVLVNGDKASDLSRQLVAVIDGFVQREEAS